MYLWKYKNLAGTSSPPWMVWKVRFLPRAVCQCQVMKDHTKGAFDHQFLSKWSFSSIFFINFQEFDHQIYSILSKLSFLHKHAYSLYTEPAISVTANITDRIIIKKCMNFLEPKEDPKRSIVIFTMAPVPVYVPGGFLGVTQSSLRSLNVFEFSE